jgi:hypothetical protein
MINKRFHFLVVAEELSPAIFPSTSMRRYRCICDCGNNVIVLRSNLLRGATKSCGCWKKNTARQCAKKHGMSTSDEYKIWYGIKKRCYKKTYKEFHLYGGRGISMSDQWLNSFESFYKDMGNRPSKSHSIDRINVNGNYCIENCRWATDLEQSENTRRNHLFLFEGKLTTLRQISILSSVNYHKLYNLVIRKKHELFESIQQLLVSCKEPTLEPSTGATTRNT